MNTTAIAFFLLGFAFGVLTMIIVMVLLIDLTNKESKENGKRICEQSNDNDYKSE